MNGLNYIVYIRYSQTFQCARDGKRDRQWYRCWQGFCPLRERANGMGGVSSPVARKFSTALCYHDPAWGARAALPRALVKKPKGWHA
jgi:hypothetical protein